VRHLRPMNLIAESRPLRMLKSIFIIVVFVIVISILLAATGEKLRTPVFQVMR